MNNLRLLIFGGSIITRSVGLIIPILLSYIFDPTEYAIYASSMVLAASLTAFVSEATSFTIYHFGGKAHNDEASSRYALLNFYKKIIIIFFILIFIIITIIKQFTLFFENANYALTILLSVGYLLPVSTFAISSCFGLKKTTIIIGFLHIIIGIPIAILLGLKFGIMAFGIIYALIYILYAFYIYSMCKKRVEKISLVLDCKINVFVKYLMPLLLAFALGAPVHGICLGILAGVADGAKAIASFVSLYSWILIGTIIPTLISSTLITEIRMKKNHSIEKINYVKKLISFGFIISAILYLILFISEDYVKLLYGNAVQFNSFLFHALMLAGFIATNVSLTTQILVALGANNILPYCAMVHALLYIITTYIFVIVCNLQEIGLSFSYGISMFISLTIHLVFIMKNISYSNCGLKI